MYSFLQTLLYLTVKPFSKIPKRQLTCVKQVATSKHFSAPVNEDYKFGMY